MPDKPRLCWRVPRGTVPDVLTVVSNITRNPGETHLGFRGTVSSKGTITLLTKTNSIFFHISSIFAKSTLLEKELRQKSTLLEKELRQKRVTAEK